MTQKLGPKQRKWLRALRSGKYRQGRAALRRGNRFCCLGVACDLFVPKKARGVSKDDKANVTYFNKELVAPRFVVDLLKLRSDEGQARNFNSEMKLIVLNDGVEGRVRSHSFKKIADLIEADPKMYFRNPA